MSKAGAGKGVDPMAVDPTKNVLDLVEAAIRRQDDLREMESRFQNAAREAESRRLSDLAAMSVRYEEVIEKMRQTSLDSTSTLLATQLKETKNDLSDRMSKQEQFRWETGGGVSGREHFKSWLLVAVAVVSAIVGYLATRT